MEALDVCSKPKRARRQNFSIMEMNIIHNEVKANPVLESKFSNVITNKRKNKLFGWILLKRSMLLAIQKEQLMKWGTNGETCVGMPSRNSQSIGGRQKGPEGGHLLHPYHRRFNTEIVDMYKDCSSFMGIPGGMETSIYSETGVILNNLYMTHEKKNDEKQKFDCK